MLFENKHFCLQIQATVTEHFAFAFQ